MLPYSHNNTSFEAFYISELEIFYYIQYIDPVIFIFDTRNCRLKILLSHEDFYLTAAAYLSRIICVNNLY